MATELIKTLYTARATAHGGRSGHAVSSDGVLDVDLEPPAEMGGKGGATNPEQLFAAGLMTETCAPVTTATTPPRPRRPPTHLVSVIMSD
jgi:hypothetical protein